MPATKNLHQLWTTAKAELLVAMDVQEASEVSFRLLELLSGASKVDVLAGKVPEKPLDEAYFHGLLARLKNNEPLQYVFHQAFFFGLEFYVAPGVLIPRPETEELVALMLQEWPQDKKVTLLDIGTGSGCIPIALFSALPKPPEVFAADISDKALTIARQNAAKHGLQAKWLKLDILTDELPAIEGLNLVVSNPPYVTHAEKEKMHARVLDYEPSQALFVPDENPLVFYEAIAKKAILSLESDGRLYFEINEQFGKEVATMLFQLGFKKVQLRKDLTGKNRFVSGLKP